MAALLADRLPLWGDIAITERASGGVVNTVFFATLNGKDVVIRVSRRTEASLRWELDLLGDVRQTGLATAPVIATKDGRDTVDGVVVFDRVRGRAPAADDWSLVRDYLSQLHRLGPRPQRPGVLSACDLLTADAGGDIDLSAMPPEAAARCRAAWTRICHVPTTVIHGDPGKDNILVNDAGPVLIDWDEARVDASHFDLAALPDHACPLVGDERCVARQAASAWEAAIAWHREADYARWRLSQLDDETAT